ncbi:UBN2_2 domain-containing protein [Cephalotus follicularis]|uniref:UBN2_2 domain-containing protein n=1 Tax=Cephalotus follicularis TaxID=3775 RepID=A0A1Q3BT31_CEPFO|nr:UBN2_2 domain-containing protein [Cephalotus follicularis]
MIERLRIMSAMIRDLKNVGNTLSDEQQVQDVIRSLPDSWISMRQIMTHNENIKNFADVSHHVEFEVEREEMTPTTALFAQRGKRHGRWSKNKGKDKSSYKQHLAILGKGMAKCPSAIRASVVGRRTRPRSSIITVRK